MLSRYGADRGDIAEILDGEPRYRIDQIWSRPLRTRPDRSIS